MASMSPGQIVPPNALHAKLHGVDPVAVKRELNISPGVSTFFFTFFAKEVNFY